MSVGEQQAVPPGVYVAGHEAGGDTSTLWKSVSFTVMFMLASHELYSSLMIAAPGFGKAIGVLVKFCAPTTFWLRLPSIATPVA